MVKITNGIDLFEVSKGAFDGIYSHQGFSLATDEVVKKSEDNDNLNDEPEKSIDELFEDELLEKPISQWNKEEVKKFAEIKKIDLTGTKNANEAKELIKTFLDSKEV